MLNRTRRSSCVPLSRIVPALCAVLACFVSPHLASAAPQLFKQSAPDFYQINAAYPGGGQAYCVPTAAADGVAWFHDQGLTNLPDAANDVDQQEQLVIDLGSAMSTDASGGTTMLNAEQGLRNYLETYYPGQVTVSGRGAYVDGNDPDAADWTWTGQQVSQDDTCVIVIGSLFMRYQPPGQSWTIWERIGGHAVFLVGYDSAAGKSYCHDPDTNGSKELAEYPLAWNGSYYTIEGPSFPIDPPAGTPEGTEIETELRWSDCLAYQVVPEPASLAVLAAASLVVLRHKRRL